MADMSLRRQMHSFRLEMADGDDALNEWYRMLPRIPLNSYKCDGVFLRCLTMASGEYSSVWLRIVKIKTNRDDGRRNASEMRGQRTLKHVQSLFRLYWIGITLVGFNLVIRFLCGLTLKFKFENWLSNQDANELQMRRKEIWVSEECRRECDREQHKRSLARIMKKMGKKWKKCKKMKKNARKWKKNKKNRVKLKRKMRKLRKLNKVKKKNWDKLPLK